MAKSTPTKKAPAGAAAKKTARKRAVKKGPAGPATKSKRAADVQSVPLGLIVNDTALQTRVSNDGDQIDNLVAAYEAGEAVPPVVLFHEWTRETADEPLTIHYYLGDGWHRYFAHLELKRPTIPAVVHNGGRAEALKYALGANAAHGLRRTNADKRKAVTLALQEYPKLSDRAIAEICRVSHQNVSNIRKEVSKFDTSTRTGRDGKQYSGKGSGKPEQIDFFQLLHEQHDAFAKQGKALMKELSMVITNPEAPHEEKLKDARAILAHADRLKTDIKDLVDALESQEA